MSSANQPFRIDGPWHHRSLEAARFHLRRRSLPRLCRRHARVGAARQRRAPGRPVVQISPPARHPDFGFGRPERAGRDSFAARAANPIRRRQLPNSTTGSKRKAKIAFPRWLSIFLPSTVLLSPVFSAGFYYKTFMWPASFWEKLYEPMIRRAAGLGRAAKEGDPDSYDKANAFCDVLVIGSGPAGLMAALSAARAGARVILADESFAFGGRLLE